MSEPVPQLLENLWLISGPTLTHAWDASAYLVAGKNPTLIDCGSSEGYSALKRVLHELGYQPGDITQVIATHGHWDHVSGMAQLREESEATLLIHAADREQVETGDAELTSAYLYELPFPAVRVDGTLEDEQVLSINDFNFTVLHTPGHTPGSICLLTEQDGKTLLIAGDTLWGGYHPRIRSDMEAWTRSLDRLLEYEFEYVTAGHCPPRLIAGGRRKVEEGRRLFGAFLDPWFKLSGVNC